MKLLSNIKKDKIYLFFYIFISLAAVFYSFTQVDLHLTLTTVSIWQTIQKFLQNIGFTKRTLSTLLFIFLILSFFTMQIQILKLSIRKKINRRQIWTIILIVSAILTFSYPAFSYDFFNYLFSAKTILVYQKNPYLVLPQQFIGFDPWIYFMRWVHLPSAYTPVWILFTLPGFLFGFGVFALIMLNMKIVFTFFYLTSAYFLEKIMHKISSKHALPALVFFALSPLVLTESIISPHNDIAMIAFVLIAVYLLVYEKKVFSFLMWSLSVAVKLMTLFLFPIYVFGFRKRASLILMLLAFVAGVFRKELLSWYGLWMMPFFALNIDNKYIKTLGFGFSLGLVLTYTPYLYFGHYNPPVTQFKWYIFIVSILLSLLSLIFIKKLKDNHKAI